MADSSSFVRVPFKEMLERFRSILVDVGFEASKADECASIFATNSLEGIYTHGVNRFPRFVEYVKAGHIKVHAAPTKKAPPVRLSNGMGSWLRDHSMRLLPQTAQWNLPDSRAWVVWR
ncbi:MAG: Ldh family oxidoreductase [Chryseolinea sp.]